MMIADKRIVPSSIGPAKGRTQLAGMKAQLPSYRQRLASRIQSVSGSRVHGWHPPQQEQQLAPPQAVAAPEALPATEIEPEQQQQEAAAPQVPRDNAYVRRQSQERMRMARDLGLNRTATTGSSGGSSSSWLELAETAAVVPAADTEGETDTVHAPTPETAAFAELNAANAPTAGVVPPASRPAPPKGWSAAAAAAAAAVAPAVALDDVVAAATAVDAATGTTTYTFTTGSSSKKGSSSSSTSSSISRDGRPRIFDSAVGTAVDVEAAAAATTAAANAAAATAAAANVASVESSWLYAEQQPLQVPNVQVVRMELARSPDGSEPLHFYMPDPLAMPCMCVEAGGEGRYHNQQQQQQQQVLSRELVAACWRQAGRVAAIDKDPEEEGFVLLDYEEQEHQMALQQQQAANAAVAAGAAPVTEAAAAPADASVASTSSSSSSTDGEADAAAAAAAQQLPEQQQQQQEVQPDVATVEFCFHCETQPGERLWLVGDAEVLGNWDAGKAAKMKWGEGHTWSVSLPFPQGTKVTYKAVLQLADKEPKYWRWQSGPNCVVEARSSSSSSSSNGKPLKVKHDFK